jgi:TolB-like protein
VSLYREFKRRKVFRVAVVYAATAFVVLQAAELLASGLGLPDWVFRAITVLVVVGFPIALVLAWALEVTPEGVRRTPASTSEPEGAPAPALLGGRTIAVATLLVAVGVGLGAGLLLAPRAASDADEGIPTTPEANAVPDRSVAVLPFADFSPESDQAWFSDGLAEEILNALARLPDLRVASRTGSFQFRDRSGDVRAIADSLGVAHILEGSVRRAGEQVRITAQLIRAADDAHLWSQNFDRDASDVIRVQEEIAFEIARTLRTALDPEELARMVSAGTNSVAAHDAYLQFLHLYNRATELEDWPLMREAQEALDEARTLDPQFHRAHLDAADFWITQLEPTSRFVGVMDLPYAEREARAVEALRAAEASAPDQVSRLRTERARAVLELRLRDALTLAQQVVEIEPDGEEWRALALRAAAIGRYDLARDAYREAVLRPHEVRFGLTGVAAEYHRVDPEGALELAERWIAEESQDLDDLYQMHRVLLAGGRVEQGAELAERYMSRSTDPGGGVLVRVRQLCAERRTAEAEAYVASLGDGPTGNPSYDRTILWHALNYLGRPDEAAEMIRYLDDSGELYALSDFLGYTFFDPRPFPNLSAALRRTGSLREVTLPIPYQCPAGA